MNVKEGVRRLALFAGVLGAIIGGFGSYIELQSVLNQRARHDKFEQLAASDVVKQATPKPNAPTMWNPVAEMRAKYPRLKDWSDDSILKNLADPEKFRAEFPQYAKLSDDTIKKNIAALRFQHTPDSGTDPWKVVAVEVDQDGIKTIHWAKDYGVESIETSDGQTLYPTPAPNRWRYLLIASLPLLGFVLPWGLVRAVGWVGAGFVTNPK